MYYLIIADKSVTSIKLKSILSSDYLMHSAILIDSYVKMVVLSVEMTNFLVKTYLNNLISKILTDLNIEGIEHSRVGARVNSIIDS